MAGKTMEVSVLVKLIDRMTAPLRGLQRAFERFGAIARRIGTIGAAIAGISFAVPLQQAAAFDQKLRDMVVTAGAFGQGAERRIREIGAEMEQLALKVGILSDQLTDARALLTSAGLDDALITRLMPTIGRVAKAASADALDTAKTASALASNLKIGADQMELALAKLITAGKLGRFEFKDMARELPELTAQFAKFGVTGMEAVASIGAALQVAMFGTSSTSTAANNFKNFLAKILSPDAIKNFKDAGVDIVRVMADATAKGINPIEAAIQKILKLTKVPQQEVDAIFKKAKAEGKTDAQAVEEVKERIKKVIAGSKLGELFGDMQVLDFLVPMMLNIEKYKEFKEAIKKAGLDDLARDFDTQFAGLSTQMLLFGEIGTQAMRRVGLAFAKNLPWMNEGLQAMLRWVARVDKAYPGLIDNVLTVAGGFLAVVTALAILGPVVSAVGAGIGVLITVFAAIFSPIGAAIAVLLALAGVGILIWRNWSRFAGHFGSMWQGLRAVVTGAVQGIASLLRGDWAGAAEGGRLILAGLKAIGSGALGVLRELGTMLNEWIKQTFGVDVVAEAQKLVAAVTGLADQLRPAVQAGFDRAVAIIRTRLDEIGGAIEQKINSIVEATRTAWNGLYDSANAAFEKIKSAWSSAVAYISGLMPKFSVPSWLGGGGASGAEGSSPAPDAPAAPAAPSPQKQSAIPSARAVASRSEVGGRIVVSAVGGAQVERVQSSNPTVPLVSDRGAVVGRA
ncbi:phage tail tape measure protein [Xanthobacter autotrophicus]|uniref:phage tail tape measure protein n=1 Tax=Xanthobacter TaxID=279 RepID=UPI0024ABDD2B|nr:phage tail tape measure protein [Xanthobacter autotrophicus]MDI4664718.1 phage tail tape measure protein [Xanthobacter autotrophicus]